METIRIWKSPEADSRTARRQATVEDLMDSTKSHICDVEMGMRAIAEELIKRSHHHDHTKIENMPEFHAALTGGGSVKETAWYQKHITTERHHLKAHVPDDVNLIDVLEHVIDCTMAAMARSGGKPYDLDIDPAVLQAAIQNTSDMIMAHTTVLDPNVLTTSDIGNEVDTQ